jgi:hypothetical protein
VSQPIKPYAYRIYHQELSVGVVLEASGSTAMGALASSLLNQFRTAIR